MRKLQYEPSLRREVESEIGEGMSEIFLPVIRYAKPYVSLTFSPIQDGEDCLDRMDVVYLKGTPYIACCKSIRSYGKYKEFYISSDFGGFIRKMCSVRFDSYEDFEQFAQTDQNARLLLNCTNISPYLFDLAARNYGTKIPIGWDFEKYERAVGVPTKISYPDYKEHAMRAESRAVYLAHQGKNSLLQSVRRNRR